MNLKSTKSWLIITAVLVVLLCSIASYVNTALPAYIDSPSPSSSEDTTPELPEMNQYLADCVTFEYPSAWTQAQKGTDPMFLDNDGTYLLLQKSAYRPQINAVTKLLCLMNWPLLIASRSITRSFLPALFCFPIALTALQPGNMSFGTGNRNTV